MNPQETTHHPLGMSRWPAWNQCPCFDGKEAGENATAGTRAHAYLAYLLNGSTGEAPEAEYAEIDTAEWAAEQVYRLAKESQLYIEQRVSFTNRFGEIFGTPDVYFIDSQGLPNVADFKLYGDGSKDYTPQLMGYAKAIIDSNRTFFTNPIHLHTINGISRSVETVETEESALILQTEIILTSRLNPNRQPKACDWCNLCTHAATCPALLKIAAAVHGKPAGTEGGSLEHLSLAGRLVLAKAVMKWALAVENEARWTAQTTPGGTIEGDGVRFELKAKQGQRKVGDICGLATALQGVLPPAELIRLCKVGHGDIVAALRDRGMSKKEAAALIEPYFPRGEGGFSLGRVL